MTNPQAVPRSEARIRGGLPERRRFTVDEYHRMSELGILPPDERTELLDGEIFRMAAIGSRHAVCVSWTGEWFLVRLLGRAVVRIQNPVRLNSGAEPEPDIAVVRLPQRRFVRAHPTPPDVFLLIEVSDTSLPFDRRRKLPRYAETGIPEVWIIDLAAERVYVYREPAGHHYQRTETVAPGGTLKPIAFPDLSLSVEELFSETHPE